MNQNQASNSSNSPSVQEANDYVPYVPPASDAPKKEILKLNFSDPFIWLRRGWQDLLSFKSCTTFFGVCFFVMAVVLGIVFRNKPEYTMSIVSGCLLLGPFLALGLYEVSRRNELGLPKSFIQSTTCWRNHIRSMGMLVLVLIVLELLWGRASLVVFAVFFNTGMPSTTGVMEAIFNAQNLEFLLVYAMVGGVFAALVFAVSVVSIPMILDRDTDAISAAITSIQVVFVNLPVMLLWGALLTVLVAVALIPAGLGLIVIGPWLGYATWHAYRGSVKWLDKV
ncbi:MAG: DUF2189 domain-containing protein [Burkholderiaceae bacterium]|jgi:uncharacterized membrane protein|nr:DUF2189 domain-containing protein [Polaromonas sp.]MBK9340828.1 DUF2189 domain-containing protein [Rhodoferax sp.]MBP6088103.1 DUF2189 domain-containing protein [Polaromonas sp.]MBP6141643.1 DUF2189 domain-containing protein [Polaromonas sp.]MBP6155892.1 DUF2189 domain-containing protein [Polaromonas sp.]